MTTTKSLPLNSRIKAGVKQPSELFTYSRDIEGNYQYDTNNGQDAISYYYLPDASIDIGIDLQGGFSKFKKIPEEENMKSMEYLLRGIMKYEQEQEQEQNVQEKINCDIITFRGIMTKIMTIPTNPADSLDLYIVPYDGSLFIDFDNNLELERRNEQDQRMKLTNTPEKYDYIKKCEYSGYKFETIATIPKPWNETSRTYIDSTRNKKTVNNYEQYLSVIRTKIGNVKIILAGEIDCCWDYLPDPTQDDTTKNNNRLNHYVELKTSRVIENNMQVVSFEKKLFRTWCQCFLMGVEKIIYGFRDDNLILRTVEYYNTSEIPIMIRDNPLTNASNNPGSNRNNTSSGGASGFKKKNNCTDALKWYGAVTEWVNTSIDKSDESKSYRLKYDPVRKALTLSETSPEMNQSLRNGDLLTEEFKQWRESLKTK